MPPGADAASEQGAAQFAEHSSHELMAFYVQAIASLRAKEERLSEEVKTFPLPPGLQSRLQSIALKPALRRFDLPITEQQITQHKSECDKKDTPSYVIAFDGQGRPQIIHVNITANILFQMPGIERQQQPTLVEHLAAFCLPDQAGGRFPKVDFKTQQALLGLLAKDGLYEVPQVRLTVATGTNNTAPYFEATVHARQAFSPDGYYVWTVCELSGTRRTERLTRQDYEQRKAGGTLVFPLPKDIFDLVRERSELLTTALTWIDFQREEQKILQDGQSPDSLEEQSERESMPYPEKLPHEITDEELIEFFDLKPLEQAIKDLPHDPDARRHGEVEYLHRLRELLKRMLDKEMKQRLWKDPEAKGEVSVYPTREGAGGKYFHLRATTEKKTATLRDLTPEEVGERYGEEAAAQHKDRWEISSFVARTRMQNSRSSKARE